MTEKEIGLDRISPSALDCYLTCPKLFYYRNWLGLKLESDSRHFAFGTAVHAALENLYLQYDRNFGGAWEGAEYKRYQRAFDDNWKPSHISEEEFEKYVLTKKGQESGFTKKDHLYECMKKDGHAMIKSYWDNKEWLLTEHGIDIIETEEYMRVEMYSPEDPKDKLPIPLSMRLDALGTPEEDDKIIEFKTSAGKYNEEETREKIQGRCYSWGKYTVDKKVRDVDYVILLKDRKTDNRLQVIHLKYDVPDMMHFYEQVKSILQKIANREFSPPPIGHAFWCDCKKFDELLDVSEIRN